MRGRVCVWEGGKGLSFTGDIPASEWLKKMKRLGLEKLGGKKLGGSLNSIYIKNCA